MVVTKVVVGFNDGVVIGGVVEPYTPLPLELELVPGVVVKPFRPTLT